MVLVERHLIDMTEDAPVYEMANKTSKSGDSIALDFIESHFNVLSSDLFGRIMQRLREMTGTALDAGLTL